MIYLLHGLYLNDDSGQFQKDCRLRDMDTVQYLYRVANHFPRDRRFMSVFFDIESNTDIREAFPDPLKTNDTIVMTTLMDLNGDPPTALRTLEELHTDLPGLGIFILSISYRLSYAEYREALLASKALEAKAAVAATSAPTRDSKYSWALKEYAAVKRCTYPQVSFEDLTRYTGIPYRSILYHIKSTRGYIPERKPSRPITEEEIEEIRKLMSN